jgi:GxxExxY protein
MLRQVNEITEMIIGSAIEVHRELGPGLLENAYEACLMFELLGRNLKIERQKLLPVRYKDQLVDGGYRLDLLAQDLVIIEVKAIEKLDKIHTAQLLSYLRFVRCPVGLLFNLNVRWLTRDGIRRVIHNVSDK